MALSGIDHRALAPNSSNISPYSPHHDNPTPENKSLPPLLATSVSIQRPSHPHPNLYGHITRKNSGLLRLMWTLFLILRLYPNHDTRRVLTRIARTPPSAHALVMGCAMVWADQQSATVVLRTTM